MAQLFWPLNRVDFYLYKKRFETQILPTLIWDQDLELNWQQIAPLEARLTWARCELKHLKLNFGSQWIIDQEVHLALKQNILNLEKNKYFGVNSNLDADSQIGIYDWLGPKFVKRPMINHLPYTPPVIDPKFFEKITKSLHFSSKSNSNLNTRIVKLKFLISLALSLGLYLLLGLSNPYLFAAALTPVWWLLTKVAFRTYEIIKNWVNAPLKTELELSLALLEESQNWIAHRLSPGILDIAHFDIATLEKLSLAQLENIDLTLSKLRLLSSKSRLFKDETMRAAQKVVINQLKNKKNIINNALQILADSLPDRIKEGIVKLEPDLNNREKLVPVMQTAQLEKLRCFVCQYGTKEGIQDFKKQSDLVNHFFEDFKKNVFFRSNPRPNPSPIFRLGTQLRNTDSFKGWRYLLSSSLMPEGKRKEAALSLLDLLAGKLNLTPLEFDDAAKCLTDDETNINLIRESLFLSLNLDLDTHAHILLSSQQDKNLILDWHQKNKAEILRAQDLVGKLFSPDFFTDLDDTVLANYFDCLDMAELASILHSKQDKNKARDYFKSYQGESNLVHCFLRFVPLKDREAWTKKVATQRLSWLLVNTDEFNEDIDAKSRQKEINLFKDHYLNLGQNKWCFDAVLNLNLIDQRPFTPSMSLFLENLKNMGLAILDPILEKQEVPCLS